VFRANELESLSLASFFKIVYYLRVKHLRVYVMLLVSLMYVFVLHCGRPKRNVEWDILKCSIQEGCGHTFKHYGNLSEAFAGQNPIAYWLDRSDSKNFFYHIDTRWDQEEDYRRILEEKKLVRPFLC